jgi:hypothetical protein
MEEPINALKGPGPLGKSYILKNLRNMVKSFVFFVTE